MFKLSSFEHNSKCPSFFWRMEYLAILSPQSCVVTVGLGWVAAASLGRSCVLENHPTLYHYPLFPTPSYFRHLYRSVGPCNIHLLPVVSAKHWFPYMGYCAHSCSTTYCWQVARFWSVYKTYICENQVFILVFWFCVSEGTACCADGSVLFEQVTTCWKYEVENLAYV